MNHKYNHHHILAGKMENGAFKQPKCDEAPNFKGKSCPINLLPDKLGANG